MWMPQSGDRVEVENIGKGKIIKVLGDKVIVCLDKFGDLKIQKKLDKIKPLIEIDKYREEQNKTIKPEQENINIKDTGYLLKRTIESLRFGVVAEAHIAELTLGYDELESWYSKGLSQCEKCIPKGFEISGPYGTGKSHTLALIRTLARKRGFLTAKVEIDGQNVTFSNHKVFLNNLWNSLSENEIDHENPLLSIYVKVINNEKIPTSIISNDYDRIRNNIRTINELMKSDNLDKYAALIEGVLSSSGECTAKQVERKIKNEISANKDEIHLDDMIGRYVDYRDMDFVESLIGHAIIARLAGYKGLIITVDEFEIEYMNSKKLEKAENTLMALNEYLMGETEYFKAPLGIFIAALDQEGNSGDSLVEQYISLDENSRYRLRMFDIEERLNLAERIHKIYCEAYSINEKFDKDPVLRIENKLIDKSQNYDSGLIRLFVKQYISYLDSMFGPPEVKIYG